MPKMSNRVAGFGTTIFTEINQLASQHGAINLGQGKPDFDTPSDILEVASAALRSGTANQYPPGRGAVSLRTAIAAHAERFYNLPIDPDQGVVVTSGATVGVLTALLGTVDKGDEVIVIEPFFDSYVPNITMLGATPVYVPLHPPEWTFDPDELNKAFNKKTRAIIINTPHNPTGRVFNLEELTLIADLCKQHDVTVISDEVYEHLTFENTKHIPIATLPDMLERTVTVSSMGKTFSATGWKVGWTYGKGALMDGVANAHQYVTFSTHHPSQIAAAYALNLPGTYYEEFQALYAAKRDILTKGLIDGGFKIKQPEGTFFVMADFSDVFDGDDIEFSRYLTAEVGVACIPPTFFYSTEHAHMASTMARFAFCKDDSILKQAVERLSTLAK